MNPIEQFELQKSIEIGQQAQDSELVEQSRDWMIATARNNYSYHFSWLGRPVIQFPQDIIGIQEVIWRVKPDLIVETGIAHGGSLIFSASMLELLGGNGRVVGVDIDIREHNRAEIEQHPMAKRIAMIQGSSIDSRIASQVVQIARERERVMVILDSNHTHDHVLQELHLYSPLVTKGSYLIVLDTVIEDMPAGSFPDRAWDKGNNPKTAVHEFLKSTDRFRIDNDIVAKLLVTVAPDGYLVCVGD